MGIDYSFKIENLKGRRYDEALKEPAISEAFTNSSYSYPVKYALESMLEIDPAYAYKVYAISRRIHEKIRKALKKRGYYVDYRYQGELKTHSNIVLYGDVEIIVIKNRIKEKPHKEIQAMAHELIEILKGDPDFKSLDYSDKTRIRITALKPTCEIDILPSIWIDSLEYKKTKNEVYRGIAEFDFKKKRIKKYLPFLNIARINAKDQLVNGNLTNLSRLLKTLRADSDVHIDLRDSEINAMVYSLSEQALTVDPRNLLKLLPRMEKRLSDIFENTASFNALLSPSGKDRVFSGNPEKKQEVGKLRDVLATLIKDVSDELSKVDKTIDSQITYP